MNMAHKQGVFEEKLEEYCAGGRVRKGEILDSVTEVSGLTRKGFSSQTAKVPSSLTAKVPYRRVLERQSS